MKTALLITTLILMFAPRTFAQSASVQTDWHETEADSLPIEDEPLKEEFLELSAAPEGTDNLAIDRELSNLDVPEGATVDKRASGPMPNFAREIEEDLF